MKSSTTFVVKQVNSSCEGGVPQDVPVKNKQTTIVMSCQDKYPRTPGDGDVISTSDITITYLGHPRHKMGDVVHVTVADQP